MIHLGLDTWLWASKFEERHLYCIERVHELGAQVIDFSINDPRSFPVQQAASLVKLYGLEAVTSTAMPLTCNPISPSSAVRAKAVEYMKALLEITACLGSKLTGGVNYTASGYLTGHPRTQQELEWAAEYMRSAATYAAQEGITIAVEAVKRFESHLINTAEQALEFVELVGMPNVKVHLDTFHMNIEESNLPGAIEACGNKLGYLHLVDSNRGVPGMGHVPWLEVYKALQKIGYDGPACIETFNPETLDETCSMTYLTRRFGSTPEELAKEGLKYLRAVETLVYG